MGQIVSAAAKPKRCNKNQLSQLGVLAAGLHVLVSSDNSMNAAGQGNFDCHIVGDGQTAATELELKPINVKEKEIYDLLYGSEEPVSLNVDAAIEGAYSYDSNQDLRFITTTAYYTYSPIDVSAYRGRSVRLKVSLASNFGVYVVNEQNHIVFYICGFNASNYGYTENSQPQYVDFVLPSTAKFITADIRSAFYTGLSDFDIETSTRTSGLIDDYNEFKDSVPETYAQKVLYQGKNLYNPSDAESGFIQNSSGVLYPSDVYVTSAFIEVKSGVPITVSPRCRKFLAFDSEKTPISASYSDTGYTSAYTYTPAANGFIRVSFRASDAAQIELGTSATSYEPFIQQKRIENDIHLSETMKGDVESLLPYNILNGKKWAHCGDSFSDYTNKTFSSGIYTGKYSSFPRLIAERNGMTLEQTFMLSGRTIGYPSDGTFTNSLTCPSAACYFQNIPADIDYVTIMLGINDINHRNGSGTTPDGEDATGVITLGTIDSFDTSTYYGAFNTVLTWLRTNRPFAHVGIIVTNGLGNTATAAGYKEAQIALAKKYGYPYLDLNGDQHTPAMNRYNNSELATSLYDVLNTNYGVDSPSNTHPNWQAHEYESTFIEAWLRSL